jgi:hypothetical protein
MRVKLKHIPPAALAASMALVAMPALAACGSTKSTTGTSAKVSTSTTAATATTPNAPTSTTGKIPTTAKVTPPPKSEGQFAARIAALRACLIRNGIPLPNVKRSEGLRGLEAPKGVSAARYAAALKKCGGSKFHPLKGSSGTLNGLASVRHALVKFAECMRSNGVKLAPPNASGKGPVFSTAGIDTSSPQFKAAMRKCRPQLANAYPLLG